VPPLAPLVLPGDGVVVVPPVLDGPEGALGAAGDAGVVVLGKPGVPTALGVPGAPGVPGTFGVPGVAAPGVPGVDSPGLVIPPGVLGDGSGTGACGVVVPVEGSTITTPPPPPTAAAPPAAAAPGCACGCGRGCGCGCGAAGAAPAGGVPKSPPVPLPRLSRALLNGSRARGLSAGVAIDRSGSARSAAGAVAAGDPVAAGSGAGAGSGSGAVRGAIGAAGAGSRAAMPRTRCTSSASLVTAVPGGATTRGPEAGMRSS
jgi:hypothetical protein